MSKTIASGTTISGGYSFASANSTLTNYGVLGSSSAAFGAYSKFGTVTAINFGTMTSGLIDGVYFTQVGSVTNKSGGVISGPNGIKLKQAGSVTNDGSISGNTVSGYGVYLVAGGSVTNQSGGTIGGKHGVKVKTGAGTVTNYGTITANITSGRGVYLLAGGSVTNQSSALISGYFAIRAVNTIASVVNDGTLEGNGTKGFGVQLLSGGLVTNQSNGIISGYSAVQMNGASGTVQNAGLINSTVTNGTGIFLVSPGLVTNQSGGTISGNIGVDLFDGGTLLNAGTITGSGGVAVTLASGVTDHVVFYPGGKFVGTVSGGNTIGSASISTLELASTSSTGVIGGLGSTYVDFARTVIDSNAQWQMTGYNSLAAGSTLTNSGTLALSSATLNDAGLLTNNGEITLDPSALLVTSLTGTGSVTIGAGGTLDASNTVASGETITLAGLGSILQVDTPTHFAGTIAGFGTYGTIDLTSLQFITGTTTATVNSSGTLIATTGTTSESVRLTGTVTGSLLVTGDSGGTGTDISVLCFCAGTGIATPDGETLVEHLAVGDEVLTAEGTVRRVTWVGVGRVLATRGRRSAATPIIVRRGALADNVPHRDLHVTKGHGLLIDGVLIPAEFLVNHRSIMWDDRAQEVMLYHVELESHDILVANGAMAESYRDDGNRWLFANASERKDVPPQPPCVPVVTGGPVVDAVWLQLLERAGPRSGVPLTQDPDLHVLVNGRRLNSSSQHKTMHVFKLPSRCDEVRIVSRAAVPAEIGVARDPRPLGVAIRRIVLRQGSRFDIIKCSDPRLVEGFHKYEPAGGLRWTDGDALLPPTMHRGYRGRLEMLLEICATSQYPTDSVSRAA